MPRPPDTPTYPLVARNQHGGKAGACRNSDRVGDASDCIMHGRRTVLTACAGTKSDIDNRWSGRPGVPMLRCCVSRDRRIASVVSTVRERRPAPMNAPVRWRVTRRAVIQLTVTGWVADADSAVTGSPGRESWHHGEGNR